MQRRLEEKRDIVCQSTFICTSASLIFCVKENYLPHRHYILHQLHWKNLLLPLYWLQFSLLYPTCSRLLPSLPLCGVFSPEWNQHWCGCMLFQLSKSHQGVRYWSLWHPSTRHINSFKRSTDKDSTFLNIGLFNVQSACPKAIDIHDSTGCQLTKVTLK